MGKFSFGNCWIPCYRPSVSKYCWPPICRCHCRLLDVCLSVPLTPTILTPNSRMTSSVEIPLFSHRLLMSLLTHPTVLRSKCERSRSQRLLLVLSQFEAVLVCDSTRRRPTWLERVHSRLMFPKNCGDSSTLYSWTGLMRSVLLWLV